MNTLAINGQDIAIKEHQGQRVVTFKEIDRVHQRPNGTAGRNFRENRKHFIEGVDYFTLQISTDEIRRQFGISKYAGRTITLLTETGYLMLVKSFTDDLAWKVQRELVRNYFTKRTEPPKVETPRKSVDELLKRVKERDAAIEVIRGMIERFTSAEYLIPLSDTLRMLYFDSVFDATDIKRAVERELPARS